LHQSMMIRKSQRRHIDRLLEWQRFFDRDF